MYRTDMQTALSTKRNESSPDSKSLDSMTLHFVAPRVVRKNFLLLIYYAVDVSKVFCCAFLEILRDAQVGYMRYGYFQSHLIFD